MLVAATAAETALAITQVAPSTESFGTLYVEIGFNCSTGVAVSWRTEARLAESQTPKRLCRSRWHQLAQLPAHEGDSLTCTRTWRCSPPPRFASPSRIDSALSANHRENCPMSSPLIAAIHSGCVLALARRASGQKPILTTERRPGCMPNPHGRRRRGPSWDKLQRAEQIGELFGAIHGQSLQSCSRVLARAGEGRTLSRH